MRTSLMLCLYLLISCQSKPKINNQPIEIYRMSGIEFWKADYYVIYHHEGKSDTAIVNSVIDFNRQTMSFDSLRNHDYYCRRFYKQDKDLTKDYQEDNPEAIRDYAKRCIIDITWRKYKNVDFDGLDSLIRVIYYIENNKFPSNPYPWSSDGPVDSLLLNPISRW